MDFNIFGVGLPEMLLIFLLMLTVAGPKRMIKWAYELGRYTAKFRAMFQETMDAFKREIEASDIDLGKDVKEVGKMVSSAAKLPRFDIVKEANKVVNESTPKTANGSASSGSASSGSGSSSSGSSSADSAKSTDGAKSTQSAAPAASTAPAPAPTSTAEASDKPVSPVSDEQPRYDSWQPK